MAGGEIIAPGCLGTGADGRCFFDEFLQYIQSDEKPWTRTISVGTNLLPNVANTAQELSNLHYNQWIEPGKLVDGLPTSMNFENLFGPVVDNIQKSRQIIGDLNIDDELGGVREAMTNIHDMRIADQAAFTIQSVNQLLEDYGYNWVAETKTVVGLNGQTWQQVDTERTINAHSDAFDGLGDVINKYMLNIGGPNDPDHDNRAHLRAIAACASFGNRLYGDSKC